METNANSTGDELLGMPAAAARIGRHPASLKRALETAGVPLVQINARAYAVRSRDLDAYVAALGDYGGMGRPKKKTAKEQQASA